jgi:hypothetical protein
MKFRGAACYVERFQLRMLLKNRQDLLQDRLAHHFPASRRSIDVTVHAGLIAEFGDIDLESIQALGFEVQT